MKVRESEEVEKVKKAMKLVKAMKSMKAMKSLKAMKSVKAMKGDVGESYEVDFVFLRCKQHSENTHCLRFPSGNLVLEKKGPRTKEAGMRLEWSVSRYWASVHFLMSARSRCSVLISNHVSRVFCPTDVGW